MSTNLTVNLSATLQATLKQPGVFAYAVVFDSNGMVGSPTTIVDSSQSTPSILPTITPTFSIPLPPGLNGGKVYFIIQSVDVPAAPAHPVSGLFGTGGVITQESDINWNNAASSDFRYDSFEISLLGKAGDAGNLTDVNVFGIPMSVSIDYPNGATSQTRGYAENGASIFTDISAINSGALVHTYSEGPLSGDQRLAAAPATALATGGPGGASAADWNNYVESLGANGASDVRIAGYFNGAYSVDWMVYNGTNTQYQEYHNPGFYSYTLTWVPDPGAGVLTGTYVLTPESNSQIQGTIKISSADLANSIYATLGNATVENPDGTSYQFSSLSNTGTVVVGPEMSTGANNEWGAGFVKLLTGFIGGYLGGTTTPLNSLLGSAPISLSENWNFDPTFAFGGQIAAGQPGAVTPWTWSTATYGTGGVLYDAYAHVFFSHTNSYGNGYSDALMSLFQQGGPLIATGYSSALAANPFATTNGSSVVTVTDPNAGTYTAGDLVTFGGVQAFAGINMDQTFAITPVNATTYTVTLPGGATANATLTAAGGSAVVSQMNVSQITLNLFDDNEPAASGQTLPETQGYTPTVIYDTYDSSVGPLVTPLGSTGAPNLSLILGMGVGQMRVDPDATVSFGFYTGQSGGLATFQSVEIPTNTLVTTYGATNPFASTASSNVITVQDPLAAQYAAEGASVTFSGATAFGGIAASALNQTFQIAKVVDSTHYQIQISTAATATATGGGTVAAAADPILDQTWNYNQGAFMPVGGVTPTGSTLQLNGLPYDTGVNWYQLSISKNGVSRTYNMYMDATASLGVFNPQYLGNNPGSIALDNLASLPASLPSSQYLLSVNVGLFNGGTLSMDPSLLTLITDSAIIGAPSNAATWPAPIAPVLGILAPDNQTFVNWTTGGSNTAPAYAYNTPNSSLADVTNNTLLLGWQGSDQQWIGYNAQYNGGGNNAIQVVGSYTNKVSGLDVGLLTFSSNGFTSHTAIPVTADIDGKWVSGATQFGNGTYSVTMTEYLPGDTSYTTPVAPTSAALQFTVNAPSLAFANTGGGGFLELDPGGGTGSGSWIHLQTTGSSMPNGTLLAFATDALGNMIGRDGGITTDLSDAVLAQIGSVAFDNGTVMHAGTQAVFLPVGQQLHFAVQTGNNTIEQLPGVQITGTNSLSVSVNGSFGTLNLQALVDNNLSASANLAASQRDYNEPWAYLMQGQGVRVDVAGSAFNMNTIHFVHIDVDASTGGWSVGGVDYANTPLFRQAVASNWDPGFAATGGRGDFSGSVNWTPSTGTGFYAPVMATEGGDIFVIGNANVDGQNHIRMFGQNTFGFEDLRVDQNADFDYNDVVVKLTLA